VTPGFVAELAGAGAGAEAGGGGPWAVQLAHPFVRGVADGSLPEAAFRWYVRQDYVFLVDYGRLLALGASRAPRLEQMTRFAELARSVLVTEMDLHRAFAAGWEIAPAELEAERPAPATAAYCDFLLRTAALGDFAELVAALLPCMWSYAEIGRRLASEREPGGGRARYAEWIAMYASPEFGALAAWCRELADEVAAEVDGAGRARMHRAFATCSAHETSFWDAAWAARR